MPQDTTFTKFVALIDIDDPNVQNMQDIASVWGDIRQEFEAVDATIEDAYAALGQFDFVVMFEGPSTETAFKADVILERHGLSVQTMEVIETSEFSTLVEDL